MGCPLPSLPDPRNGNGCLVCLSSKFVCIVMGWVQLVLWTLGTLCLIFSPSSVNLFAQNATAGQLAVSIILSIVCTGFCASLVYGVHKDRPIFIRIFYIYALVMILVYIITFFVNVFVNTELVDFKYFIQCVVSMGMNIVCFLIARGYYLMTYCNRPQTTEHTKDPLSI